MNQIAFAVHLIGKNPHHEEIHKNNITAPGKKNIIKLVKILICLQCEIRRRTYSCNDEFG